MSNGTYKSSFAIGYIFFVNDFSSRILMQKFKYKNALSILDTVIEVIRIDGDVNAKLDLKPKLKVNTKEQLELGYHLSLDKDELYNYDYRGYLREEDAIPFHTIMREHKQASETYDSFVVCISNQTEVKKEFAPIFPPIRIDHQARSTFPDFAKKLSYWFRHEHFTEGKGYLGYELQVNDAKDQDTKPFREKLSRRYAQPLGAVGYMCLEANYILEWITRRCLHALEVPYGYDLLEGGGILQRLASFPAILGITGALDQPNYWYFFKNVEAESINYTWLILFEKKDNIEAAQQFNQGIALKISLEGEHLHVEEEALSLPLKVEIERVVDGISGQEQALTNCAQLIKDVLHEHSIHSIQFGENLLYKSIRPKGVECFKKYGLDPNNEVYYFYYKHASKHSG